MYENDLEKLEYFSILEELSNFCSTYLGKKFALDLRPFTAISRVNDSLEETLDATTFLYKIGKPSIGPVTDISDLIPILNTAGILGIKDLLRLASILKCARELSVYSKNKALEEVHSKSLDFLFSSLYQNKSIEDTIFKNLLDETTIEDTASTNLATIRRKKRNLEQSIKEKLKSFLSSSYSKYIQEAIITIRNERYVIPVKEEYRSFVKGFIHDISSTGSTIFIEPISIFEMNNEMANLTLEENNEIEKILAQYSSLFIPILLELQENIKVIGKLDFIFAKATYALAKNCHKPIISNTCSLQLLQARHPLISEDTVVPIDVYFEPNIKTIAITGPNTGGKTVTLKTVGLLCLMACSGLFIPASEKSVLPVFDFIFAAIGDEQSIAESLSTFSSHLKNIIRILQNATCNSLVLLDELGSGTDPIEGSSLAISILEFFNQLGCLTLTTTHYPEIKNYCLTHPSFQNASCEFDIENLKPTYHLLMGIPGKSNAFAISKKLGLQQEILDRAKSLMDSDTISMEELLKNIYDEKLEIEREKEKINQNSLTIENLKKSLEQDLSILEQKKLNLIENAKIEAKKLIEDAKQQASLAIQAIQEADKTNNTKQLNQIRNELNQSIKSLAPTALKKNSTSNLKIEDIKIGDIVFIPSWNKNGTILSIKKNSNQVQVQIGSIKTYLPIQEMVASFETSPTKSSHSTSKLQSKPISTELNIIGFSVEEALFLVDKYLDDCMLSHLQDIRIVHGKGTGTLRNGIHTFLKKHPHVKSFRLGTFGEGETGVTIVELKY